MGKNYDFLPANWVQTGVLKMICAVIYDVCVMLEKAIADSHPGNENEYATNAYLAHFPSGSSLKQAQHFT
jgi:hypothetical protein